MLLVRGWGEETEGVTIPFTGFEWHFLFLMGWLGVTIPFTGFEWHFLFLMGWLCGQIYQIFITYTALK